MEGVVKNLRGKTQTVTFGLFRDGTGRNSPGAHARSHQGHSISDARVLPTTSATSADGIFQHTGGAVWRRPRQAAQQGIDSLVLDCGYPGGIIDSAVYVASRFQKRRTHRLHAGPHSGGCEEYRAETDGSRWTFPCVPDQRRIGQRRGDRDRALKDTAAL